MKAGKLGSQMVCLGCGHELPPNDPAPYRCPEARPGDDIDHVLGCMLELRGHRLPQTDELNPFVRYRELSHAWRRARRKNVADHTFVGRVRQLDKAIEAACGTGFRTTQLVESPGLAAALGLTEGAVWIKDETRNVGGSHKARHLMGIALGLDPADTSPLAIASCGNAALAAAVVAQALGRPLETFVPPDAPAAILTELEQRGATVIICARAEGDPPGDPCVRRFEERVQAGAVPFSCQGPSNGLAIEGGRTLAFELIQQHAAATDHALDRLIVQVGGGALASSCAQALREAVDMGDLAALPQLHAVQTAGGHPLERAWTRFVERLPADADEGRIMREIFHAATHRSEFMWPWETTPTSSAGGILDDETYDWLAIMVGMLASGGGPVVVSEEELAEAQALAHEHTDIPVGTTGSAGLAGALSLARAGAFAPDEHIALLFTGVQR